jgi:Tfp pilus assembly protein PilF
VILLLLCAAAIAIADVIYQAQCVRQTVRPTRWEWLANTGVGAMRSHEFDRAEEAFREALAEVEKFPPDWRLPTSLANFGNLRREQRRWKEAGEFYQRAAAVIDNDAYHNQRQRAIVLNSLGVVLLVQGKPHEATQTLRSAALVYDSLRPPDPEEHARTLSNCAGALLAEGSVAGSLKFAARAAALRANGGTTAPSPQ